MLHSKLARAALGLLRPHYKHSWHRKVVDMVNYISNRLGAPQFATIVEIIDAMLSDGIEEKQDYAFDPLTNFCWRIPKNQSL
jgi:hypothetical protein